MLYQPFATFGKSGVTYVLYSLTVSLWPTTNLIKNSGSNQWQMCLLANIFKQSFLIPLLVFNGLAAEPGDP